jgi:hypothetical protein
MKSKPAARDNCGASSLSNDGAKDLQIKVSRMEKTSKRGKIPQQDWPSIIARYQGGETLSSIARSYDCSPPAISYIVSRTRARNATVEMPGARPSASVEPQLIKAPTSAMPVNGIAEGDSTHNGADGATSTTPFADSGEIGQSSGALTPSERWLFPEEPPPPRAAEAEQPSEVNRPAPRQGQGHYGSGYAATPSQAPTPSSGPSQNGEARRTLHLSLSQGNGAGPSADSHAPNMQTAGNPAFDSDSRPAARPQGSQPGFAEQYRQAAGRAAPLGPPPSPLGAVRGPAAAPGDSQRSREGGAFIDHALRERIDGDITAFLAAFDAALDHDTAESRTGLREATDRLLRAGARTRIELERLEARVPLASREKDMQTSSLFRPR